MRTHPSENTNIGTIMSNLNCKIEPNAESQLKDGFVGEYAAWNFFAFVWYEDNIFYAEVKQYCSHIATIEAESLQKIMEICCSKYGND